MKTIKSNKKVLILVPIILGLFVLGGCVKKEAKQGQESMQEEQREEEVKEIDTSDWKTYRNEEFGFEVKHPESWSVQRSDVIAWKSFHFNKTKCLKYKDDVCDDEFLTVNISNKSDSELRTSSLWSWAIPEYRCDERNDSGYGAARKIPLLRFNISYPIQTCELNDLGYKWQNYMFTKDNSRWLFVIRYNNEGYDSPTAKKILETFQFTKG